MSNRRQLTVWDARNKKRITYNRSTRKHSKEAIDKEFEELAKKHREINYQYKLEKKRGGVPVEEPTEIPPEVKVEETPVENPTLELSRFPAVNIERGISLKLDPGTGNSTVILGSSKKGKSTLMMHIYETHYKTDPDFICTLFSPNIHAEVYRKDGKMLTCHVFNHQSEKYVKLEKYINSKTGNRYKFLNMFDDIIQKIQYAPLVNDLILTYRNSNMSTILCLQYLKLMSKMNRANANNIIIFGSNSAESILDLINTFLRPYFKRMGIVDENEQVALFKYVTENHGFFYINNGIDHLSYHRL